MGVRRVGQIDLALSKYNPTNYRLTPAQFEEIKRLSSEGVIHKDIARSVGVTRSHVTHILNGRVPKWLG